MGIDRLQLFNKKLADMLIAEGEEEDFISGVCFSELLRLFRAFGL